MDSMELFERLESAWFFSNVLSTKHEPTEPTKPANETPEISNPSNNPQPGILIRRAVEGPMGSDPVVDLSRSPRRREEDERRRLRRRQRTRSYSGNGGVCRANLNILEGGIEFCRGGELKRMKDERAMKRQLKTWAVAVAVASASASASSAAQTRPMVALCC